MACPFLEYRDAADDRSFDVVRAYCTAADAFVQPMRADVCNDRYALEHATHCEIYREHGPDAEGADPAGGADATDGAAPDAPEDR